MSNIIKSFRIIEKELAIDGEVGSLDLSIKEKILNEAKEEYKNIIAEAEKQAEGIMDYARILEEEKLSDAYEKARDIILKSEKKGYENGFKKGEEKGYKDGHIQGYNEGKKEAGKIIKEALEIKRKYMEKRSLLLKDLEEDIIHLVISIYEKVLNKKIEEDEDLILSLVLAGIENLESFDDLTVIVSKEDYLVVNEYKDLILAKASMIDDLNIKVSSDMKEGDCILETSKGSVDISIKEQLKEVKDFLMTILSNR